MNANHVKAMKLLYKMNVINAQLTQEGKLGTIVVKTNVMSDPRYWRMAVASNVLIT